MTQTNASTESKGLGTSRPGARMLENKCAVVFGAGGSIGTAVAKEFAAEGARVFLAGRKKASLEAVAEQITATGGEAHMAVVDALDDVGVNRYVDGVAKQAGKIDVVVDLTGPLASEYGNGKMAVELPVDEFMASLTTIVKSHFITARAVCREAMRLTAVLLEHPLGSTPTTYALAALMCLNAARLPARVDASGDLRSLFDQDRSAWDQQVIGEGMSFLDLSAKGSELSEYHLQAAIASVHATDRGIEETDWRKIVSLYDSLMVIRPSPIVALNRAIAIAQRDGAERGIEEIRTIADADRLTSYPFYWAALGEFELRCRRYEPARQHFRSAFTLARNEAERHFFSQRLHASEEQ